MSPRESASTRVHCIYDDLRACVTNSAIGARFTGARQEGVVPNQMEEVFRVAVVFLSIADMARLTFAGVILN